MQQEKEATDETSTPMDMDEVELVLRRFASKQNDTALIKLLNAMFTETAEQKIAHETSPMDKKEDMKEGD